MRGRRGTHRAGERPRNAYKSLRPGAVGPGRYIVLLSARPKFCGSTQRPSSSRRSRFVSACRSQRGDVTSPARGYMEELRDGLTFLWGDRVLRTIMMTVGVTNFLDAATVTLMPVYAQEIYGSSVSLGLLVGAGAGGSVVTALIYAARRDRLPRRRVLAACFTVRLFDTRSSPSSPHLE